MRGESIRRMRGSCREFASSMPMHLICQPFSKAGVLVHDSFKLRHLSLAEVLLECVEHALLDSMERKFCHGRACGN